MCGLCGVGDVHAITQPGGVLGDWPANARALLADKGLAVADAPALFGGAAGPTPLAATISVESDETGFSPLFDIPAGTGTGFFLGTGQRINAQISVQGDTDWFRMSLVQGETYQISLKALPFFGLADPELYLFDAAGGFLILDDNSGEGLDSLLTVTATRTGIYYVGATGFGGNASTTGNYEISLARVNFGADTVGDTRATAGTVKVDGSVNGTIDFGTDTDLYAVDVEKGKTYAVFLDAAALSFTPLADPKVEVLDRDAKSVAFNDDNGITRNAALTFTADYDGKYYIRASGGPANTGDFTLTVADFSPPPLPDPLDALDWGVKFNKTDIKYYFALQGETYGNELTDSPWNTYEMGQARAALAEYSVFSKLTFKQVDLASDADFILTKNFLESSTSGRMIPQDPAFGTSQGVGWFNTNSKFWSREADGFLEKGAYGYSNFIHEFGHGLGLSHPHDNGGTSAVLAGVTGSGSFGKDGLNQEVFTVMSYNKGWQLGPNGGSRTDTFGIARTPMAFDVAKIQEKYGVNTNHNDTKTTYALWTKNQVGTGYETIWDTGGRDTIVNPGAAGATIDLRPATLKAEPGGGGFVSFVTGVFGGYSIANGVRIENATGGSGNDTLIGNNLKNRLDGKDGRDVMIGGKGNDTFVISETGDVVQELARGGNDRVQSATVSLNLTAYKQVENIKLAGGGDLDATGSGRANVLKGNKGDNTITGNAGKDTLKGASGQDDLRGDGGADRIDGGAGDDVLTGGKGADAFVFKGKFGDDRITDFTKGADQLLLSKKLWSGSLTEQGVIDKHADIVGGAVVFDFGTDQTITLTGVGSLAGLADDLVLT